MGADCRLVDEGFDIGIRASWEDAMRSVRETGGTPYAIPAGASVHKYGGFGYVGFAADDRADRVIGIDGSGTPGQLRTQMRGIVDQTADLVELGRPVRDAEIAINPDYAYPAYGVPSNETNEAIRLAAQTEAMITDPVHGPCV